MKRFVEIAMFAIFFSALLYALWTFVRYLQQHQEPEVPPKSYLLVQYRCDGTPSHCWQVKNGLPALEISAPHLRVPVAGDDFATAARTAGVLIENCNGRYAPREPTLRTWRPGERP